jgi:protein-S-isoprenylcysteine O-methyltransferase Ste14
MERDGRVILAAPHVVFDWVLVAIGAAFLAGGLWLFVTTVALFWTRGRGTLAPWDPPRVFVADGPYRHVRNPMIPLLEEPMLVARFGDSYREHRRHVRMFAPRLTPWQR